MKTWTTLNCATRTSSLRTYAKGRAKQIATSHKGRRLDAKPTVPNSKKPTEKPSFAFGNFATLQRPGNKRLELVDSMIKEGHTFESLRIFPTVRAAMIKEIKEVYNLRNTYVSDKGELQLKPSPIQIAAIKRICKPRKVLQGALEKAGTPLLKDMILENELNRLKIFTLAAETGSGKTWAYLAAILTNLKEADLRLWQTGIDAYKAAMARKTVRAIILVPTHELVSQVYGTLKRAAQLPLKLEEDLPANIRSHADYGPFFGMPENQENLNLNVMQWGAGDSHKKLFDAVKQRRIDVLVTTPAKFSSLGQLKDVLRPFSIFNFTEQIVVDEADSLLEKSWITDTLTVLQKCPRTRDLILCSATIPKEFEKSLKEIAKDDTIHRIVTPQIHKIPPKIVVKVIDAQQAPYHGSKTRCLAQALYAIHNDGTEADYVKRIIIFVNNKKDVEPLAETLIGKYNHREEDIAAVTGRDLPAERADKIAPFVKPAVKIADDPDKSQIKILITTDLLARGLDFLGVKNVILMDVPSNSADLLHRMGRTGRMRQSGRVFILLDRKTGKSWIKGLPTAVKRGITIG